MFVLNFHGVGAPQRTLEVDEDKFWVDDAFFGELVEGVGRYHNVRITFDDGNLSDYTLALPVLERHGVKAEFFILAGKLDDPAYLGVDEVRELVRLGHSIGSHGWEHRDWRRMTPVQKEYELVEAPALIATVTGRAVRSAAVPFGSYDRRVIRALRRSGFNKIYTSDGGPTREDSWICPRTTITAADTLDSVKAILRDDGLVKRAGRVMKRGVKRVR